MKIIGYIFGTLYVFWHDCWDAFYEGANQAIEEDLNDGT